MKLRIVTGSLKGRVIKIAESVASFRPTKEMVRAAISDSLGCRIQNARVADFCAGSGAYGFELISRGADSACFIEINRRNCDQIRKHAEQFMVIDKCHIFQKDIRSFLRTNSQVFDILFYDPPYDDEKLINIISDLLPCISEKGILIYERKKQTNSPSIPDGFNMTLRKYGKTIIELYTRNN